MLSRRPLAQKLGKLCQQLKRITGPGAGAKKKRRTADAAEAHIKSRSTKSVPASVSVLLFTHFLNK